MLVSQYQLDDTEKLIKDIVIGMIQAPHTEAMIAPMSGTYYISNKKLHYYIRIDEFSFSITNHKFSFKEGITSKFGNILIAIVNPYMEKNRKDFEQKVFNNQLQLLNNIKNSLQISK